MKEELKNRIAEAIRAEVGEKYNVFLKEIKKNNGLVLQAVEIRDPEISVSPIIYIDDLLNRIVSGEIGVDEAAQKVIEMYKTNKGSMECDDVARMINKPFILDKVEYQLINEEKNRERLCNIPNKKFLDLAAIYRVIVGEEQQGTTSFVVTNAICEKYGLNKAELDQAARQNTEKKGFKVQAMTTAIAEITGVPEVADKSKYLMWVITNTRCYNGASVMLYDKYFAGLAENIKSDLYVLPSSIHEVIAVPVNKSDPDRLKEMVKTVNSLEVMEDEILSENVYRYNRREGNISIA